MRKGDDIGDISASEKKTETGWGSDAESDKWGIAKTSRGWKGWSGKKAAKKDFEKQGA